jgi:replicative DNA helicase
MYDAMVAIDAEKAQLQDQQQATDAKAAQEIAYLQDHLQQAVDRERQANAVNAKFMDYLVAARAENAQLKDKHASEIAKLNQEHASEVAKLKEEHHKASTTHAEKVKAERMAEIARLQEKHASEVVKLNQAHDAAVTWLMEEHEIDIARAKHAAEAVAVDVVQDAKKDIALALFPDLDVSLL